MGRGNKKYVKDLREQMYDRLTTMLKNGEGTSKKDAIKSNLSKDLIFSYNTFKDYYKHCKYYAKYITEKHPECTTLKAAKKYVNEWLQIRVDQVDEKGNHLSAWTIHKEAKALGKLYGIEPDNPKYFTPPKRKREDIKRSRGTKARDRHFSVTNNDELIKFCRGTGCRRNVLMKLEGRDLWTRQQMKNRITALEAKESLTAKEKSHIKCLKDALECFPKQDYFIHHRKDKGGKYRFAPIIGDNKEQIIERMKNTGLNDKVWEYVNSNADIHGYRGDYATYIYKKYARKIEDIPYDKVNKGTGRRYQGDVYACRKDESGKKLDRAAMLICSKALGHNRVEVVANNYIRGL